MSAGTESGMQAAVRAVARPSGSGNPVWGYYLAAGLLLAMGLIFLNDFRYALAAEKRWTPAAGRVTESKVVTRRSRRSTSYSTYVSYVYSAEDSVYSNGPVELNKYKLYFTLGSAEADIHDNFPQGRGIDVYYNPVDPSESSLGLAGAPGPSVAIIFILLAAGAVYLALQEQ